MLAIEGLTEANKRPTRIPLRLQDSIFAAPQQVVTRDCFRSMLRIFLLMALVSRALRPMQRSFPSPSRIVSECIMAVEASWGEDRYIGISTLKKPFVLNKIPGVRY